MSALLYMFHPCSADGSVGNRFCNMSVTNLNNNHPLQFTYYCLLVTCATVKQLCYSKNIIKNDYNVEFVEEIIEK